MTQTLARPATRRPVPGPRGSSPWVPGLTAAAWAACAGLVAVAVPVLVVWAADGRSGAGAGAALQLAAQIWLVANGASLSLPGTVFGLVPLGLALVPLTLLARAGAHAVRGARPDSLRSAAELLVAVVLPYTALVGTVALLVASPRGRPEVGRALVGSVVVAAVGVAWGGRTAGHFSALWVGAVPDAWRRCIRAGALVGAALLSAGSLLAGATLGFHLSRAAELARASGPGVVGGTALLALGLAAVPNAAVWGASWLAGPGFAVGTGTAVGPFGTHLGAAPALPLLAGLPSGPAPVWMGVAAIAGVVVAGAAAGRLMIRGTVLSPVQTGLRAVAAGPAAGLLATAAAAVSGGPLGSGRLAAVGPSPWRVGVAVSLEVTVGAVGYAAGALALRHRRRQRAR